MRILDNLFETNKSPQFWSLLHFYINFQIQAAKTPCKHSTSCTYGKACWFNHGIVPSASPDRQSCHNPYHSAPTFSQRYHVAPISVQQSTQTTDQGQRDITGITSAHSKQALGSTDHIKYIFSSKQSTNDKQKSGAQQTVRSEADIHERTSCQGEPEDSNNSDDSWHSISRQKR